VIADAEFVQFHPTALDVGRDPAPLATEALRGDGAILINKAGERFMLKLDPAAELAARDVVARGVFAEIAAGRGAFLDVRPVESFAGRFPTVFAACQEAGIDPMKSPIPVAPAAHYHMGGCWWTPTAARRSTGSGPWVRSRAPAPTAPTGSLPIRCWKPSCSPRASRRISAGCCLCPRPWLGPARRRNRRRGRPRPRATMSARCAA
jgi:hypothetical protein